MKIKTLEELINEGVVDYNTVDRNITLPLTETIASVVVVTFPNVIDLSQFVQKIVAPKLDPEWIWSTPLGLGRGGVALLFRKTTFKRHIQPML